MSSNKLYEIMNEYDLKRRKAQDDMKLRKEQTYRTYPQIKDIDDEIRSYGLKMAKLAIENNLSDADFLNMEKQMQTLIEKKSKILMVYGLDESYLEAQYQCMDCKDTGYLPDNTRCSCLEKRINEELFKHSNITKRMHQDNFQNFNIDIFSTNIDPNKGISPRKRINEALGISYQLIENIKAGKDSNLLIYGSTGTGKTYLSSSIANTLIAEGIGTIYQTANEIGNIFRAYKFPSDFKIKDEDRSKYESLFKIDVLFIDDLGTEGRNSFISSELFNLINERIMAGRSTIISTNFTLSDLIREYDERIFSRIVGNFSTVELIGKDLRRK